MTFADSLSAARSRAGLSRPAAVASLKKDGLKVSERAFAGYERGEREPEDVKQKALLDALAKLAPDQSDGGQGVPPEPAQTSPARRNESIRKSDDEFDVIIRTTIRPGASQGLTSGWRLAEGDEYEAEKWRIARQRMYDLLGIWLEPGDEAIYIEGWSMKRQGGGLDSGQLVIYRPTKTLDSGHRYVVQVETMDTHDFQLFCKRVQALAGGAVRLISDNRSPGFTDELLTRVNGHMVHAETKDEVRLHVVGRVVWPREDDEERQIRLITQTIERLAASGLLST